MDLENKENNSGFVKKPVDQPILTSDVSSRLSQAQAGTSSSFYQNNKLYIWAFAVGIIMIAILSLLAFRKPPAPKPTQANIQININAPDTVASGGDEVYKIEVVNKDPQKLVSMELELVYPDGITYQNSSPGALNLSGTSFKVPDLISGQNAVVIVKTRVTGSVNDTKDITAKLHYQYSNISSEFVAEQHFSTRLVASNILVNLTGPDTANNGQIVAYTLTYQNNSDQDAQNARITLAYPQGFTFASADPKPDLGNNTWNIGTLAKGGNGTIQIQGAFSSVNPGETAQAVANFLILGNDGNYFTQNSATFNTAIANQPLLVTQSTDSQNQTIVNPGDTITYHIKYQNNAQVAANSVNIVASLDSSALDLSTIQTEGGQVNNNTITWNASSASQLQLLAPSEGGEVQFSVRVKNPATKDSSTKLTAVSHIKIKSNEYDNYFPGSDLTLKISSPSSISRSVTSVSGSLPPKVGTKTVYKVRFALRNSTNDFSNAVVTAYIPLGAGSFDQASLTATEARNVSFDTSSGKLTWNVGALPAHTGQFNQSKMLEFNINFTPSANQAYSTPTLVKNISMAATDTFTSASVLNGTDDITTASLSGQDSYNYGQVVQ